MKQNDEINPTADAGKSPTSDKTILVPPVDENHFLKWVKKHPVMMTVIIGLSIAASVYFWKDMETKKQKAAVVKMANEQLIENNQQMLKLLSKPLVWSIRSEILRDNLEQVNILTKDMVKEKNIQVINVIEPAGKIIISTDKRLEGKMATGIVESDLLETDSVLVSHNKSAGVISLAAPVMGYDRRLGIVTLVYKPEIFRIISKSSEN